MIFNRESYHFLVVMQPYVWSSVYVRQPRVLSGMVQYCTLAVTLLRT